MKNTLFLIFAIVLLACNNNPENAQEAEAATEEVKTVLENKIDLNANLLGTWVLEDTLLKVAQVITYKEDGTYQMQMASMDVSGTWELTDSTLVTKSRPDAPGQNKTIIKLDNKDLWVSWVRPGTEPKELKYVRKVD